MTADQTSHNCDSRHKNEYNYYHTAVCYVICSCAHFQKLIINFTYTKTRFKLFNFFGKLCAFLNGMYEWTSLIYVFQLEPFIIPERQKIAIVISSCVHLFFSPALISKNAVD